MKPPRTKPPRVRSLRTAAGALAATGALLLSAACSGGPGTRAGGPEAAAPSATGSPAASPAATAAPPPASRGGAPALRGSYVALGDSYTSGPRIPPQHGTPEGCERSGRNYPALVARALRVPAADFRDVSCSGAVIADLASPQGVPGGANPAQFSALSPRTALVTVGIGGNDVGFIQVLTRCVQAGVMRGLGLGGGSAAPCRDSYTPAGLGLLQRRIDTAGRDLEAALGEVRRRAPHARVLVLGYPELVPASGAGTACSSLMGLAPGDVAFLHDHERRLDAALRRAAGAAGARYVDTRTPSRGRDACSPAAVRWIEPLSPASAAAPVHPNARGERGMADAVLRSLGAPDGPG
ncbi:SGNH/GDSL hydrolase family protein [Streptomyces sp. NPDC001380]|uniref:SGNH/GDSL hydrolase family protein n=1 Tax=Streptomyces sp. NPDC001380 TaxID=3364566 RepID=UPI0036902A60